MQPFEISSGDKYLNCCSAIHQILRKNWGNSGTFDSFLFCFNYVTFLSFESMFTENVNLKCNMSTDMYYFTFFFVMENRVYLGECPRYFASVIFKTNS